MPASQPRIHRHARDEAALDLLGRHEAQLGQLGLGELDQLVVAHLPQVVTAEAEVLEADAGL